MSSWEILNYPEYLGAVGRIMRQAGASWTLASDAYEATNSGIQIGVSDLAKVLVGRIVAAAERLKVEVRDQPGMRPRLHGDPLGRAEPRWQTLRLRGEAHPRGARRTASRRTLKLKGTHRQAAHLSRPLPDLAPRRRVRTTAQAAQPAGAAVPRDARRRHHELVLRRRRRSFRQRARRALRTSFKPQEGADRGAGVNTVVTACANCRVVMEEALEHYKMDIELLGLTELVAEHLVEEGEATPNRQPPPDHECLHPCQAMGEQTRPPPFPPHGGLLNGSLRSISAANLAGVSSNV
jgi:hypothetical protein